MQIEELFTVESAAEYLGISKQAVKQNKYLQGFLISPKMRLYGRAELDHYKAEGIGRRKKHTIFEYDAEWINQVKRTYITREGICELMQITPQAVKQNQALKRYEILLGERVILYRRTDIELYRDSK